MNDNGPPTSGQERETGTTASPRSGRIFAVIPAAGLGRRMGQPKLLLPIAGRSIIGRVLDLLRPPLVARTVVVVRPGDEPLRKAVEECGAVALVPPAPPAEMRQSVELALRWLEQDERPVQSDAWLLAPADHPLFDRAILERLIAHWQRGDCPILIPTCGGRRGHPVVLRWNLAQEVFTLPADAGVNQLIRRHAASVVELETGNSAVLTDLDTPEDYAAVLKTFGPPT